MIPTRFPPLEDMPANYTPSDEDANALLYHAAQPVPLPHHPRDLFSRMQLLVASDTTKIYLARTHAGQTLVVKKLRRRESMELESYVMLEVAMSLLNTNSDHVVDYHACYQTRKNWWLVMENMEAGSIARLRAASWFSEREIAFVLRAILLGLQYLHERQRVHRDVKAHNVLVNGDGDVKLMDFGWTAQLTEGHPTTSLAVGSIFWMAPEVHGGDQYTTSADIWSLGITAMELANLEPPFYSMDHEAATILIMLGEPPALANTHERAWSADMHDFVRVCLQKQPSQRPTVAQLLAHPLILRADSREEWVHFLRMSFPRWPSI